MYICIYLGGTNLVYGANRPYFKQKQKNNIAKFWPTGFFLSIILSFLKKNKKKNITNQEAFIAIIMLAFHADFSSVFAIQNITFKKNTNSKNQITFFF